MPRKALLPVKIFNKGIAYKNKFHDLEDTIVPGYCQDFIVKFTNISINIEALNPVYCYNQYMEKNILGKVVEAEKEIQERLDAEKAKADTWLNEIRTGAEKSLSETENKLKAALENRIKEASAEAEKKADSIIRAAGSTADKLRNISDNDLKEIISKHIIKILPGGQYDSKDVEG